MMQLRDDDAGRYLVITATGSHYVLDLTARTVKRHMAASAPILDFLDAGFSQLRRDGETLELVAEVARRAGVSPWLVRQEPLLEEIRKAQTRHSMGSPKSPETTNSTAGSLHVERDLLRQENQRLRHELQRHQRRISELLGDQIDGTDAHSQSLRVQELTDQNAILAKLTSERTQELHHVQQQVAALSSDLEAAHNVNRSLMTELNRPERTRSGRT